MPREAQHPAHTTHLTGPFRLAPVGAWPLSQDARLGQHHGPPHRCFPSSLFAHDRHFGGGAQLLLNIHVTESPGEIYSPTDGHVTGGACEQTARGQRGRQHAPKGDAREGETPADVKQCVDLPAPES